MLTQKQAENFALRWIQSWNSQDLVEILSHYADDIELISPVAARILSDPQGTVRGKEALGAYFKKGLEVYPDLRFELIDVMWGLSSIILYYVNQSGSKIGEFMEIDVTGKVSRVVANYNE